MYVGTKKHSAEPKKTEQSDPLMYKLEDLMAALKHDSPEKLKEAERIIEKIDAEELIKFYPKKDEACGEYEWWLLPFHLVAARGYDQVFKSLFAKVENLLNTINLVDVSGQTLIHSALYKETRISKFLEVSDVYGFPKGKYEIAKFLIDSGKINLNVADKDGNTTLHLAARHGDLGIIEILVNNGASIIENKLGKTLFEYLPIGNMDFRILEILKCFPATLLNELASQKPDVKSILEKALKFEKAQINPNIEFLPIDTILSQGLGSYTTAVDLLSKFEYPLLVEEKKSQICELHGSFYAKQTVGELFVNLSKAPKILDDARLCFDEYNKKITMETEGEDKPFLQEVLNIKIVSEQLIPRILRSDGLPNVKKIITQLLAKEFDNLTNYQTSTIEEFDSLFDNLVYLTMVKENKYKPLFISLEETAILSKANTILGKYQALLEPHILVKAIVNVVNEYLSSTFNHVLQSLGLFETESVNVQETGLNPQKSVTFHINEEIEVNKQKSNQLSAFNKCKALFNDEKYEKLNSSGSNVPKINSNDSHIICNDLTIIKKDISSDMYSNSPLSLAIDEYEMDKLREMCNNIKEEDFNDAELLQKIALAMTNKEIQNAINLEVASTIYSEAKFQLNLMGVDTTEIIDAYNFGE